MRPRTVAVAAVLVLALAAVAGVGLVEDRRTGGLAVSWTSDTAREVSGNHHAPAVGVARDGTATVYAPVSGRTETDGCALVALDARTGDRRWSHPIPAANCTIHAVADPAVADYDADGTREVLAATTEDELVALDPGTGAVEAVAPLSSYGYTEPIVADLVGGPAPEVVVVDVRGTVFVFRPDGSLVWRRALEAHTWGQPAVADVDGDGDPEVAVGGGGSGELHLFEADGSRAWAEPVGFDSSITWTATGQTDDDPGVELVVATARGGRVAAVDGDGSVAWRRDLGSMAAVHAVADGDGRAEVYAVAVDGRLRALDAATGTTEWSTTLTDAEVQMTPPPSLGDVDGDGRPDLVAATNDGRVLLVDPRTGAVRSTHERSVPIYTRPVLADVDGDGDDEVFVTDGHGRVVAFDGRAGTQASGW